MSTLASVRAASMGLAIALCIGCGGSASVEAIDAASSTSDGASGITTDAGAATATPDATTLPPDASPGAPDAGAGPMADAGVTCGDGFCSAGESCSTCLADCAACGPSPDRLEVARATGPVDLSGDLHEFAAAKPLRVAAGAATAVFRALWDDSSLYLSANVADADLRCPITGEDAALYDDDALEVMLDPDYDRSARPTSNDRHVIISARGEKYDASGAAGLGDSTYDLLGLSFAATMVGTFDDSTPDLGYRVALRIPWSALPLGAGRSVATGLTLGADLALDELAASSSAAGDWAGLTSGYAYPSQWKTLVLADPSGCVPESDVAFCGTRCGVVTAADNCGASRTVDCLCNTAPLTAEPAAVAMGDVWVGQTRHVPVLLTNTAATALTLQAITATGSGLSSDVEPTNPNRPTLPFSLAPGKSTWIVAVFKPQQAGAVQGSLAVATSQGRLSIPLTASAVVLTDYADVTVHGAVGDGTTDDTDEFRAAAATGKVVYVPPPPGGAHYRLSGPITIKGPGVVGAPGAVRPLIKMYGANGGTGVPGTGHVMFTMYKYPGTAPAIFTGLHLDGQWDPHIPPVGEWDALIEIRNSANVTVENNRLENPMGDCVYVGAQLLPRSSNVTVSNNVCFNPFRCTVGVISVEGLQVVDNVLEKPYGQKKGDYWYHFNLDFEPNREPSEQCWNAQVAYNHIVSHLAPWAGYPYDVAVSVVFAHPTTDPAGGNITVHDNTGSTGRAFVSPSGWNNGTDMWTNVRVWNNPNPYGCYPPLADCP